MNEKQKVPVPLAPEFVEKAWSARESWRVFGIMSEFVEATERLAAVRPAVSIFGSARVAPDSRYYQLTEQQVFDKAFDLYQKALKLDPNNFPLASDVARLAKTQSEPLEPLYMHPPVFIEPKYG